MKGTWVSEDYFISTFHSKQAGQAESLSHPDGYARVREHGNPKRANNMTYVYTWRKDLVKLMCQDCSDFEGRPVKLALNKCAKGT